MKIALYGKKINRENIGLFVSFLRELDKRKIEWSIYSPFADYISKNIEEVQNKVLFSNSKELLNYSPECLLSFGGDGTLLDSVTLLAGSDIPVLGINAGRLGFLSSTAMDRLSGMIDELESKSYTLEERAALKLHSDNPYFSNVPFALNDFTLHKRDTSAMLTIDAYVDNELLNTYWSDGLIVATPTGSTAYSLSCGGPIVFPDTKSFVITPVASHNIAIRPLILPDNSTLTFKVRGRGKNLLISLDSRNAVVDYNQKFTVCKAPFTIKFIKLKNQNFIITLREKLMLGIDNRNR